MSSKVIRSGAQPRRPAFGIQKRYRPEIEGLRIVAAVLVAVYHIWLLRVSGGVDVFFVVSGFLVSASLLSRFNREGTVLFGPFALGLLKRLLPNALVVLLFVTVVSVFVLPEVRHYSTIRELFASTFYYENWQLAATGTDYLDQGNEKSPVQHFWAMSIQGQFYVVLFLVVSLAITIARRRKLRPGTVLVSVLTILLAASLAFSVYLTAVNQPWAYFDTRARLWEFAVGAVLCLVIFRIVLPKAVSGVLGWVGFAVLIGTGLLLDVGSSFPGYAAALPVGAAVLILLAGQNPTGWGVEKVLGSRPMVFLGGYSYGLYLWHWPLLSFYYVIFDTKHLGAGEGILIILLSLGLSILSTTLVEKPAGRHVARHGLNARGFGPIIVLFLVVLLAVAGWLVASLVSSSAQAQKVGGPDYPGAVAMRDGHPAIPELEPIPALADVKEDKAQPYFDGCHQRPGSAEVIICEYGDIEDYEHTVAVVGGSKAAHWLPSLESFATEERIRVLNVSKSGCRLSLEGGRDADCTEWNENVVEELVKESPDLVVALADTSDTGEDVVPQGFLDQFARLRVHDVPVLAIRDTPSMPEDVPECLSARGVRSGACDAERGSVLRSPSSWERLETAPPGVEYVDYSNYFCDEGTCPAVIGNIVVYLDENHMSATFSRSVGPLIREDVMRILDRVQ